MHDSALGLHHCLASQDILDRRVGGACLALQDILGFASAEQINLFSSRLAPKLSNKLDILGGASAEFEQIQLCTRLAPKLDDGEVTLLRSSIRSNVSLQGLRPTGFIPACILSSRWDYFRTAVLCRDSASLHPCLYYNVPTGLCVWANIIVSSHCLAGARHFGLRLGRVQVSLTLRSACSIVLFHKTFWASPRDNK